MLYVFPSTDTGFILEGSGNGDCTGDFRVGGTKEGDIVNISFLDFKDDCVYQIFNGETFTIPLSKGGTVEGTDPRWTDLYYKIAIKSNEDCDTNNPNTSLGTTNTGGGEGKLKSGLDSTGAVNSIFCQAPPPPVCPPKNAASYGLPGSNKESAPYVEWRVYGKDAKGNKVFLHVAPLGPAEPIDPSKGELPPQRHAGTDNQSRTSPSIRPSPLPFTAGVSGTVTKAGGDRWNTIKVQLANGNTMEYRHASTVDVKVGDKVDPGTVLGKTGNKGTGSLHLHVEA